MFSRYQLAQMSILHSHKFVERKFDICTWMLFIFTAQTDDTQEKDKKRSCCPLLVYPLSAQVCLHYVKLAHLYVTLLY